VKLDLALHRQLGEVGPKGVKLIQTEVGEVGVGVGGASNSFTSLVL
jgi:hypothetical protein